MNTFFKRIRDIFSMVRGNRVKVKSTELQDDFDRLIDFGITDKNRTILKKADVLKKVASYGKEFMKMGEKAGSQRLSNHSIKALARSKSLEWQAFVENVFLGEVENLTVKKEFIEKRELSTSQEVAERTGYYNFLKTERKWNYRKFSFWMGLFYLVLAACLLIADFPLSYASTLDGLHLEEIVTINFFGMDKDVMTGLFLGIGILLSTLYFKVYFDEYLAKSIRKVQFRFKKERYKGIVEGVAATDEDIKGSKTVWRNRFIVKTVILGVLMFLLCSLGAIRYDSDMKRVQEKERLMSNQKNNFQNMPPSNAGAPTKLSYIKVPEVFRLLTYVLITLLFPLVGSVLASLGLERIQNSREFTRAAKQLKRHETTYQKLGASRASLQGAIKRFEQYVIWCTKESFVDDITYYFESCYRHGYEMGIEAISDLFDFATEYRAHKMGIASGGFGLDNDQIN